MRIGLWWVELYTLKVCCGLLLASLWLWWRSRFYLFERQAVFMWVIGLMVAALVCGRGGYVLGNASYFLQHPAAIVDLHRIGGLHGGSATAGSLVVIGVWAWRTGVPLRTLLSFLSPALLCVAAGAWWGCMGVGCAWGKEAPAGAGLARWFAAELPDIYRTIRLRYAVQFMGMVWGCALALLAVVLNGQGGWAFALYLSGAAGLALLRGDLVPVLGEVRIDFVLNLALSGIVSAMMACSRKAHQ